MDKLNESTVNWPWVKVGNYLLNVDDISAVNPAPSFKYHYGIRFKDGTWLENFEQNELEELVEIILNNKVKTNIL